jgi:hypothetical protein
MKGSTWFPVGDGSFVPQFVSTAETARLLGVSTTAVCGLCRRKRSLPGAIRFADQWLIPLGAVVNLTRRRGWALTPAEVQAVTGSAPP